MVRYPEAERHSLGNLEEMRIRTNDGIEVPFMSVADITYGNGYSSIERQDRQRVVEVVGDINRSIVTPEEVMSAVQKSICRTGSSFNNKENPCQNAEHPGVSYSLGGEQEQRSEATASMARTVPLSLLIIFALLAIASDYECDPIWRSGRYCRTLPNGLESYFLLLTRHHCPLGSCGKCFPCDGGLHQPAEAARHFHL